MERQLGSAVIRAELESVPGSNSVRLEKTGIHFDSGDKFNAGRIARASGTIGRCTWRHITNVADYAVPIKVSNIKGDEGLEHPEAMIWALPLLVLKQHA